ncbi:hypothetical protein SNE40_014463 [Patella caerulea]|uniref:Chitin-binding type-2 domain-containing protein n=1 Tax=Patella caerulea TaxID=87958 RepID=A0AAN8JID0_PATCE
MGLLWFLVSFLISVFAAYAVADTCSGSCGTTQRYTVGCGLWSRCTRYRTVYSSCSCTYSWVVDSSCTKSCGGGTIQQKMVISRCTSSSKPSSCSIRIRTVSCNTHHCPVNGGWSSYGSWINSGSCTKTCGGGSQRQIHRRTCTQPAPDYGGAECAGSSSQQKSVPCNTNPCPVNGGWTSFGSWRNSGTCSKTCGGGSQQQVQTRTCTQPVPAYGGAQCSGGSSQQKFIECNADPCPVNGGWTSYGSWRNSAPCSKTCGRGSQQQIRTRTCSQPAPAYGGAECTGSDSQQRSVDCNAHECPVEGGWSSFSEWASTGTCTVSCGFGQQNQTRTRTCSDPTPAHGGADCEGSEAETQIVDCNPGPCPVNGGWSDFGDWGDITDCSRTCGGGEGIRTRHRACTNPAPLYDGAECEGDTSEETSVDCAPDPCPINGGWSEYSKWLYTTDCSVSCGTGTRSKLHIRTCTNPAPQFGGEECEGKYNETLEDECTFDPCPVDGGWSDWGNWTSNGKCTTTCGTGEQIYTRIRKCNNPEPAFGGVKCEGKSLKQKSEICGTDPCPIDGNWSEWQDWSPVGKCSKTCGTGLINETRTRGCNNPEPQYGGEECWGDSTERRQVECINTPCPVNGNWSVWTDWETDGLCSVTCGDGEIPEKRTRTCNNPRPMYGGEACQGDSTQRRSVSCSENSCPGLCDVDGYTFAYEQDFAKYFACQGGRAVLSNCPYGNRWNEETKNCVKICPSFFSRMFAHPNDCHRYVECMWGFSIMLMCPSGTAFDAVTNRCIHEAQVTTCY